MSDDARAWIAAVEAEYEFDQAERRLLEVAAETLDRYGAAREIIERDGLTYADRFGAPRLRPEVAVERDARLALLRYCRQLGIGKEVLP